MKITKTDTIERTKNIAQRLFEEHMLVITAKDSMLHRFNEVGTYIWQLLETPKTVEQLCVRIRENFDTVDEEQVYCDVVNFIGTLEEKKLVTRDVTPSSFS